MQELSIIAGMQVVTFKATADMQITALSLVLSVMKCTTIYTAREVIDLTFEI